MRDDTRQMLEKYSKVHKQKSLWYKVVTCLAAVVVFCTTYALILPAITMEKTPTCGLEEHVHTEECYQRELNCELEVHEHTTACYDMEGNVICGYADYVVHSHNEFCYDDEGVLVCELPEIEAHEHNEDCYTVTETVLSDTGTAQGNQAAGDSEAKSAASSEETKTAPTEESAVTASASTESVTAHTHTEECYVIKRGELICTETEAEAHTHSDECYEEVTTVTCEIPESEGHTHSDECYEKESTVICTIEESEEHKHGEACHEENDVLICKIQESEGHVHDDSCRKITKELVCQTEETAGHIHDDSCYTQEKELVCELEEVTEEQLAAVNAEEITETSTATTESAATQTDTEQVTETTEVAEESGTENQQVITEEVLTCTAQEIVLHEHDENCLDKEGNLICGMLQVLKHVHTEECVHIIEPPVTESTEDTESGDTESTKAETSDYLYRCGLTAHTHDEVLCYIDSDVDVETAEDWEKTLPDKLTGEWSVDVLSIAKSQLGYEESDVNVNVDAEGRIYGYTRYGAWYGDPYGDWDSMFLSFCLNYAEVNQDTFPYDAYSNSWISKLKTKDLYTDDTEYIPNSGNLIFFDEDHDGVADRAGLVAEYIPENGADTAKVKTIEGNVSDMVQECEYDAADAQIMGYGVLPEQAFYCEMRGHVHSEECYDESGNQICEIEEHVHTEECEEETLLAGKALEESDLTEEERSKIEILIAVLEELPTADEVDAQLLEYEEADDMEGYETYWVNLQVRCQEYYQEYQILDDALKTYVYNIDKLMDLEWLWSAATLINAITSDTPTVVASASTSDFIELNLYDYGNNINTKYASNKSLYPGFQWNGGAYVKSTYNRHYIDYIDFGNSMITDFDYGSSSSGSNGKSSNSQDITNSGTGINAIDNTSYGVTNRPIGMSLNSSITDTNADVLSRTLGSDGYPALKDGTSLAYLFQNGTYAVKQNTESVDGLFQQDATSGEYYYNSRWNHAQYSNNKFTLYNQIITPNFITYPFGNFLPFNTITDSSKATQVSKIDRVISGDSTHNGYVQTTINRLLDGDEDSTENQLIDMLAKYRDNLGTLNDTSSSRYTWNAADAINDYFHYSTGDNPSNAITFSMDDDLLKKMYNIDWNVDTNFFFGMEMKMNFFQPKGGMTGNDTNKDGESDYPMVFYFTGDDDVWVYIDDVLFLDLSGIHRHVGGKIDFVNGKVYYYYLDTANTGDVSTEPYQTYTFAEILSAAGKSVDGLNGKGTFKDYTTHTFKFYYMERGSGSSVCRLNFNFPLLRRNTISVAKELSVDDETKLPLLGNPDFKFQVLQADSNGNKTESLFIGAGVSYTIYDENDNKIGTGTTDANGVFTLKAGQRAEFTDIKENAGKYYVRELLETDAFEQYGTISVNGSSTTTNHDIQIGTESFVGVESPVKDASDGATSFKFNNQVVFAKLGSLEIEKILSTTSANAGTEKEFEFEVTLDGEAIPVGTAYTVDGVSKTVEKAGIIVVPAGSTAKIEKIIAGSRFVVKETTASSGDYTVTYSGSEGVTTDGSSASGTIKTQTAINIKVTNSDGTSITIPVTKTVANPDGSEYNFKFLLEQVTDQTGATPAADGTSQEMTLTVNSTTTTPGSEFTLNYSEEDIKSSPTVFYYRITETTGDSQYVVYDDALYVIEVTVTRANGGGLTAEITDQWKNGESITDDFVAAFTNKLVRDLSLTKILSGVDREKEFTFEITLTDSNGAALSGTFEAARTTAADSTESIATSVTFDSDGKAAVTLKADETLVIHGIPYGALWTVSETQDSDYHVSWQVEDGTAEHSDSVSGTFSNDSDSSHDNVISIICTNTATYVLPETGGFGTNLYTMGGLLLISAAGILLMYKYIMRRKEER